MSIKFKAMPRSAALSDLCKEHIELSLTHINYSVHIFCSCATEVPSGAWEQMWLSKREVKHDFCLCSSPRLYCLWSVVEPREKAATVEYAQLEDKGHQMPNTSTAAILLKTLPSAKRAH